MADDVARLQVELGTFAARKAELLGSDEGRWALVHGDEVLAVFETQTDAVDEGYRKLGNVPFLVKEILAIENPQNFVSNLIAVWMPSFTAQIPNLQAIGPVVDLKITATAAAATAIQAVGQAVPTPIDVRALIDTGATGSVLQQGLAAQLGLHPVGVVSINTPSSTNVQCPQFAVSFSFPNNVVGEGTFIEAPLQGQNIGCLIGRDVLSQAVFVYIGYSNLFILSF